eukprot:m.339965 g.339965  ORF g.339965 m.339965 type:complete len:525 (-) comp19056_c0_seq1:145-1719(-)
MPAVVNFPEEIQTNAHTVVLIGAKSRLTGATASLPEDICQLVQTAVIDFDAAADGELLGRVVADIHVSDYSGGSGQTMIKLKNGALCKIIFILTPECVSRHNCATRPDAIAHRFGSAGHAVHGQDLTVVTTFVFLPSVADDALFATALSTGCAIGKACPKYSRKNDATETRDGIDVFVSFIKADGSVYNKSKHLQLISLTTDGVRETGQLVDRPCNELNTTAFAELAESEAAKLQNVTCKIIKGKDLEKQGFGGLYGVGKAAANPPALVVLHHPGKGTSSSTVCWVGKGIVYDTGGLSIKTKTGMPGMKRDMGGAGAILEAFLAAAKAGPQNELYAILCLAENAVGPDATRPDDIHTMYSGKTVEINNTDAEGRLVLGDGVAYAAKHCNPSIIVNMCTLTGAQGVATGKHFAAVMCTDAELESDVIASGKLCGDLCHPVPYSPEFFTNEFASKVADMKNSVASRSNAQVSCAGQFIGNHLPRSFKGKWLHIDMAACAHAGERGTGYGVALLLNTFVWPALVTEP